MQLQEQTGLTTLSSTFHRFIELPVEIRLLVYNELMVQNIDLYRPTCDFCPAHRTNFTYYANLVYAEILRTSKQVYTETLPILYSQNTVHMKCLECENMDHPPLWAGLNEPNHITTELIEHFYSHVKDIAIAYRIIEYEPYDRIIEFPVEWPTIEHEILERYENTGHISLRVRLCYTSDATFDLVRRSCKSMSECVQDYNSVLAEHHAYLADYDDHRSLLAALKETCDAVVLSHAQGKLKNTAFAVQRIRWKPLSEDAKEVVLCLGREKNSANDTSI